MVWQYSRRDTKLLLLATLMVASSYALLLAHDLRQPSVSTGALPAAIGVYAGVTENTVNTYMASLDQRAQQLDAREAALNAQAAAANGTDQRTLWWVAILGAGLLGLILLNFYLDHKRRFSFA